MWSGVEKVDSAGGGSQHRDAARLRQLRALRLTLLVAVFEAAPLAAQQEQQRVVRGLSFEGNHAIDELELLSSIKFAIKRYARPRRRACREFGKLLKRFFTVSAGQAQ